MNPLSLTRFAWLSIAAAILTIGLKTTAYLITDSIGLLSDALESVVNLVGALLALTMLTIAARPADEDHAYGHNKAEYFSSGVEGTLILIAAVSIGIVAIERLIYPKSLEQIGLGLGVAVIASLVNFGAALVLHRAAKRYDSITLDANAHHLMTDVWTSAGVVAGIAAVDITGLNRLDPIVALLVAANIVWTGIRIIRKSVLGLMDTALPLGEQNRIRSVLDPHRQEGVEYHALRTRRSGYRRFVSFHVLVPGNWTVQKGHQLVERIEEDIHCALPNVVVFIHLESLSDPASWDDGVLDREKKLRVDVPAEQLPQSPNKETT